MLADALFRRRDGVVRLWLGLTAGLLMMMWLPSLFAYLLKFTAAAQYAALGLAAVFALLARQFLREPADPTRLEGERRPFCGDMPAWLPIALIVPLLILSIYLQYTHTLREVDGALHVGQSTYGDLCLHLGIATGLQGSAYPPEYTLIQDVLLGYPFLMDALSASMLCLGTGLQAAFVIPGSLMMGLVYLGFILLSWELTHSRAAVVVSYLLMFLNGGLGFFYVLDEVWKDPTALQNVFTGYYAAPANMVEHNIRWVNVICDMMIPQRTLLAGWTMVVPALYLLVLAMREKSRRLYVILGVLAGAMPMVHTHSFFALALISAGCLAWTLRNAEDRKKSARRLRALRRHRRGAGASAVAYLEHPPDGRRRFHDRLAVAALQLGQLRRRHRPAHRRLLLVLGEERRPGVSCDAASGAPVQGLEAGSGAGRAAGLRDGGADTVPAQPLRQ